mmetsp:Transcript_22995/g.33651  ORF Transcript_22995/g.33651 Transcript_22995/m.33651 type:complete len:163 (-) Transcript_22995:289-777(-)|eukprot:CAMPEP_0197258832 /NCGR_PEP_ID=MMETSP1429-20130617/83206_1 /TAXON_ID=49237 /ORGANISM="Chaetoceros  sp., Strain UNC1202" /LENGTH=162 /DNA_ID=CAMNT_0042723019 /DNA_START=144 /DNA_END=632 /DNA_ORIENTATION=+
MMTNLYKFSAVCLLTFLYSCDALRPHSFLIPNTEVVDKEVATVSVARKGKEMTSNDKKSQSRIVGSAILLGVEAAEKALVDAVRDEVDILFHDRDHEHHPDTDTNAAAGRDTNKVSNVRNTSQNTKKTVQASCSKNARVGHDQALSNCNALNHYPYGWNLHQ